MKLLISKFLQYSFTFYTLNLSIFLITQSSNILCLYTFINLMDQISYPMKQMEKL